MFGRYFLVAALCCCCGRGRLPGARIRRRAWRHVGAHCGARGAIASHCHARGPPLDHIPAVIRARMAVGTHARGWILVPAEQRCWRSVDGVGLEVPGLGTRDPPRRSPGAGGTGCAGEGCVPAFRRVNRAAAGQRPPRSRASARSRRASRTPPSPRGTSPPPRAAPRRSRRACRQSYPGGTAAPAADTLS